MKKTLRIRSNFVYLKDVENFIGKVLDDCQVDQKRVAYITLGVCESVNNAIGHGNKMDENKFVTLFAEVKEKSVLFEVQDEGEGFDFNNVPDPTKKENLKNEGGRGLFLIRNLVDEVSFKNNGSTIQLKFNIDRAHSILS